MNSVLKSVAIVVGIPTLIAAIYFSFFASDVYVSETRFAIRSAKSGGGGSGIAALLASPIVSSGSQDAMVVAEYVKSQDMLRSVQQRIDIRSHYASANNDYLSRLDESATQEELLEYFDKRIELVRDSASDVITLRVRAYSPEVAKDLAELIIQLSEKLVNQLSNRMEVDALDTAQAEVDRAVHKVRLASDNITRFRNLNDSLNPAAESSALLGLVTGIESKLVEVRSELTEKRAFMRESSSEIVTIKNRVNALSRQLRLERGRLAGSAEGGTEMSGLIEDYQPLVLEQEIAQQFYASALTSLELARLEAQRKKQYLITFVQPNMPDEAIEPRRCLEVLTVMFFSFLAYAVGGLMWSALKDHMSL